MALCPPPLVKGRTLQVVATRKELLRREGERERDLLLFLSSHHWRARPWPAGKRAPTIFLSLKREVLSLVQVESNLRIKSACPLSCTINFDRGVKTRQTCQTKLINVCILIFSTNASIMQQLFCQLCSRWVLASKAARVDFIIQQLWPF